MQKELIESTQHPWEVIPLINEYVISSRDRLIEEGYTEIDLNVWVGENVEINGISQIKGPVIIGHNSKVGFCAHIEEV